MKGTAQCALGTGSSGVIKNFPNVNPNYIPVFDSATAQANATKIYQACQALASLSNKTLNSVTLITEQAILGS